MTMAPCGARTRWAATGPAFLNPAAAQRGGMGRNGAVDGKEVLATKVFGVRQGAHDLVPFVGVSDFRWAIDIWRGTWRNLVGRIIFVAQEVRTFG